MEGVFVKRSGVELGGGGGRILFLNMREKRREKGQGASGRARGWGEVGWETGKEASAICL